MTDSGQPTEMGFTHAAGLKSMIQAAKGINALAIQTMANATSVCSPKTYHPQGHRCTLTAPAKHNRRRRNPRCPVSCGTCPLPPPPAPPSAPSNATAPLEPLTLQSQPHPAIAAILSLNGLFALVILALGSNRRWVSAARLSVPFGVSSLFLGILAIRSFAPRLPLVCTAWHTTLVPMSWANYKPSENVQNAHAVSYRYHGRLYRALEIQVA